MDVRLLIIDPQNDFCDSKGSLFVPGADEDMNRLSAMIQRLKKKISMIHVTLDTHHVVDIAHPIFWVDSTGNHPNPFTIITLEDVQTGRWRTSNPQAQKRSIEYVRQLKENNRYSLVIWPYHCLIGSWGQNVYPKLFHALLEWEQEYQIVDYILKGSNIYTEHYSAIQADVPDPQDPSTMLNSQLIQSLEQADLIAIAGEALNFCVANTVKDIADHFRKDHIQKMVLLEDACSPVPGNEFEPLTKNFLTDMMHKGMRISKTTEFLQ